MAIELICPSCQQMLRVGDDHAGRQARCPKCSTVFQVATAEPVVPTTPFATPLPSSGPSSTAPSSAGPSIESAGKKWYAKTVAGQQYGPVEKSVLDQWAAERRITEDCQVLQEGDAQWCWASDVYPSLTAGHGRLKEPAYSATGTSDVNPYHSPSITTSGGRGHAMPHRGGVVLTLGILGLLVCGVLGIPAWVMGSSDLNDMKAGRMDPSGYGTTQAGMILGIVSCCIMGLGCCLFFFAAAAG